jgi:hypothetical protein
MGGDMGRLILTAAGVWGLFVILAILNAVFRDEVLGPLAGDALALPMSGVLLSLVS